MMKKLNFEKLMGNAPTLLDQVTNQRGQVVSLFEDPFGGDSAPVIAAFENEQFAFRTDFFDTGDFYPESDYMPVLVNGQCFCAFEMEANA